MYFYRCRRFIEKKHPCPVFSRLHLGFFTLSRPVSFKTFYAVEIHLSIYDPLHNQLAKIRFFKAVLPKLHPVNIADQLIHFATVLASLFYGR